MYMCHFSCYLTFCLILDLTWKYRIRNSMLGLTRFQCFAIIPRWCIRVNYYNNIVIADIISNLKYIHIFLSLLFLMQSIIIVL